MSSILKTIRNRLCKFSGEDHTIIQKCNKKIQLYFSLIGLLVLVILLCSFASALYFTENLFHSVLADIGVGIKAFAIGDNWVRFVFHLDIISGMEEKIASALINFNA